MCAHAGYTGPEEHHQDGDMYQMTLSPKHRIRNSSHGGQRRYTSATKAPDNIESLWLGKKYLLES